MQIDHLLHSALLFVFQLLLSPLPFPYPPVMFVVNQLHFFLLPAAAKAPSPDLIRLQREESIMQRYGGGQRLADRLEAETETLPLFGPAGG